MIDGPSMRDEDIPLPPEPPDEEWFEQAADEYVRVESDAVIDADRLARWERARRVHARPTPFGRLSDLLAAGPDPMGRHVGCDGDEDGHGCGRPPWEACRAPGGRYVPGFVHPSRLAREYALFDLPVPTVTV